MGNKYEESYECLSVLAERSSMFYTPYESY